MKATFPIAAPSAWPRGLAPSLRVLLAFVAVAVLPSPASAAETTAFATAGQRGIFPALKQRRRLRSQPAATREAPGVPPSPVQAAESQPLPLLAQAPPASNAEQGPAANGAQNLPSVSSVLERASQTLKSLTSQAIVLQARMTEVQEQSATKLSIQRSAFDKRLKAQEDGNLALVAANDQITKEVTSLTTENQALRVQASKVEERNDLMRTELRALQSRIKDSRDFFAAAFKESDDSHAPQLSVLSVGHGKDHEDQQGAASDRRAAVEHSDGNEEDDESDDDAPSLMELGARVWRSMEGLEEAEVAEAAGVDEEEENATPFAAAAATGKPVPPEQLVGQLQEGLDSLKAEDKDGEAKLKAMFIERFRVGQHRHMALVAKQQGLNATKASLLSVQKRLRIAEDHLEDTKQRLGGKIHNLGLFLRRLAHAALAPAEEAPRVLKALPDAVDA